MRYVDFIVELRPAAEGESTYAVTARALAAEAHGEIDLELGEASAVPPTPATDATPRHASAPPPATPSRTEPSPAEVGEALHKALFCGPIHRLWQDTWEDVGSRPDRGVRLKLMLDPADPKVVTVPWEFLRDPASRNFLGLDQRSPIVRSLVTEGRANAPLRPALLRILVVTASPSDQPELDIARELELIRKSLQHEQVEITPLEHATKSSLLSKLARAEPFHALHFIGHGDFRNGQGVLLLESGDGRSEAISGRQLAQVLQGHTGLRLVFLNACQTAHMEPGVAGHPFEGVAAALIQGGFPAVVAMSRAVDDDDAIDFSSATYTALAAGAPIEESICEGRKRLYLDQGDGHSWGIPALFSTLEDGRIFQPVNEGRPRTLWSILWTGLGMAAFLASFQIWSLTQQWGLEPFALLADKGTYAVAIYGTLLGAPLLFLVLLVTHEYQKRVRDPGLSEKLPVAFAVSMLDEFRGFKKVYQSLFLILFLILPAAAQVHFLVKMSKGTAWKVCRGGDTTDCGDPRSEAGGPTWSGLTHYLRPFPPEVIFSSRYFLDTPRLDSGKQPITFIPFYGPWIFLLTVCALLVFFVRVLHSVVRKPGRPGAEPG